MRNQENPIGADGSKGRQYYEISSQIIPTALPPSSALKAFISLPSVAELDRAFITRRLKSGWPPPAPPIGSCSPNTYQLGPLLAAQGQCIVGLVPLSVRCAVNKHNTVLHQGLGTDQFVVGCIIDNIDYSCLACTTLRAPGEVPHVQPQGPVLLVASPHTDCVYAAGANLCVGSGAFQLILLLLVVGFSLAPSLMALVPVVPSQYFRLWALQSLGKHLKLC